MPYFPHRITAKQTALLTELIAGAKSSVTQALGTLSIAMSMNVNTEEILQPGIPDPTQTSVSVSIFNLFDVLFLF